MQKLRDIGMSCVVGHFHRGKADQRACIDVRPSSQKIRDHLRVAFVTSYVERAKTHEVCHVDISFVLYQVSNDIDVAILTCNVQRIHSVNVLVQ